MNKRKRTIFVITMAIITIVFQFHLGNIKNDMELTKQQIVSEDEFDKLYWLKENNFIKKKDNKYEILGPENIGYVHIQSLKNGGEDNPIDYNYYQETLSQEDNIVKNSYNTANDIDKFILNYIAFSLKRPTFEDTDKVNERLKEYYPLLETIEEKGYFYKTLYNLAIILAIMAFMLSTIISFADGDMFSHKLKDYNTWGFALITILETIIYWYLPSNKILFLFFIAHLLVQKKFIGSLDKEKFLNKVLDVLKPILYRT